MGDKYELFRVNNGKILTAKQEEIMNKCEEKGKQLASYRTKEELKELETVAGAQGALTGGKLEAEQVDGWNRYEGR